MFVKKYDTNLRALLQDWVARLLFLNALFVILGYGAAVATGGASVNAIKVFRTVLLFGSFFYVLYAKLPRQPYRYFYGGKVPLLFCFFIFLFILISPDFFEAFNRGQTFVIPFLYIYYSLACLIKKFEVKTILKGVHLSILIIYAVPLLSYIVFGGSLSDTNIYGHEEESSQIFVSNHYGWSSALYILSFIYVVRNITVKRFSLFLMSAILVIAVILLFSAANRAALFSIAVTVLPLLFRYRGVKLWHKILFIGVLVGVWFFLLSIPGSAVNFIIEKSAMQEEEGEKRFEVTLLMLRYFNSSPIHWFTGVGIFNHAIVQEKADIVSYHNSYWEIFFGMGLPMFMIFLSFMAFGPVYRFITFYSKHTLLFAPLLIIPYFESNLTAGQFLFFPWFTYMLLLNAKLKFWNKNFNRRKAFVRKENYLKFKQPGSEMAAPANKQQ